MICNSLTDREQSFDLGNLQRLIQREAPVAVLEVVQVVESFGEEVVTHSRPLGYETGDDRSHNRFGPPRGEGVAGR
jgi:hypothetical protein